MRVLHQTKSILYKGWSEKRGSFLSYNMIITNHLPAVVNVLSLEASELRVNEGKGRDSEQGAGACAGCNGFGE